MFCVSGGLGKNCQTYCLEQCFSNFFFSRTTVTIQNMYTHNCDNTKHVHVPLSQYKTCTRTTITIQNMDTCHSHNTKHIRVVLFTANITAYLQDTCLPRSFAG